MGKYMDYKEYIGELFGPVMMGQQKFFAVGGGDITQRMAGLPSEIFYKDIVANVELSLLGGEYLHQFHGVTWDVYNCEVRGLGQAVTFAQYGCPDVDADDPLIKSEADFDKLKFDGNPLETESFKELIKGYDMVTEITGMPTTFFSGLTSNFSIAVEMMGFAKVVKLMKKQPEVAHEYFRRICDDVQTPVVKAISEKYPGVFTKFADAWEKIPNISPKMQREFVFPYMARLRENCKDCNITLAWWMTYGEGSMPDPKAYLMEKLPYSMGLTQTFLEGVDTEVYYELALEHGLPLLIHIPYNIMMDATPEEVVEFARTIAKCRNGLENCDLYALTPATSPLENIDAATAAFNAFAKLPCPAKPEEFDAIEVALPERTQSFSDFINEKEAEKAYGFSYHWVKDCKNIKQLQNA